MEEVKQPKEFTLYVNDKKFKYRSINGLVNFLNQELETYKWLAANRYTMLYELYQTYYASPIKEILSSIPSDANLTGFTAKIGRKPSIYISSNSSLGKVIENTRQEYGEIVAAFTTYYLHYDLNNRDDQYTTQALAHVQLERQRSLGAFIAHSANGISHINIKSEISLANALTDELANNVSIASEQIEKAASDIQSLTSEIKKTAITEIRKSARQTHRRFHWYRRLIRRTRNTAANTYKETLSDLDAAKAAYHDNVDLQASVSYWAARQLEHKKAKRNWLIGVILGMIAMFVVTACYYGTGGISKFFLPEPSIIAASEQVEDKKTAENKGTNVATATIVREETPEERIAKLAADMVGAIILLTIFGTLIRLGLRQFNIHSQLELDSVEKVTLTKTYLALLGENKLNSPEDRRLVLEGIFRPSNPAIAAAEAAFSTPIELILKSINPSAK